ncbi:hypothetical protein PMG71_21270 [Roseofilum sp. BLCC_M154]|uniref:Uncharacterized protein n=1 Tax=Roseofilum acuticapitatum BLCC-M154 TaxID=3022444 RepID=A0ABT7AYM7_9CYAN|nr:hypothetical protein [Roseofilum acuticapitatum]MDJ1171965.1 hypothetical protein [Roseofilum acuticapitatum BLCC-M154]
MLQLFSSQMQRLTSTLAHSSSVLTPLMVTLLVSFGNSAPSLSQTASSVEIAPSPSETTAHFPDGVYFYGESPQLDQIGHGYMVFEARQHKLLGALYLPNSSFDCFYGQVGPNHLGMTVIDSYDRTPYPYQMALEPVAIASSPDALNIQFKPQGMHRIAELRDDELGYLETCRQDVQQLTINN